MEVAFVRHGETAANLNRVHQVPDEPLSVVGIEQIQKRVPELRAWQPTHIITSPLARARSSAQIIAEALDMDLEMLDEVRELRRPLALLGGHHYGLTSMWYIGYWFFRAFVHINTVSEGESYPAFRRRIDRVRSLLEQYPADARIIVVSHSVFINFFLEHVCNPEGMKLRQAIPRFLKAMMLRNAHVTYMHYDESTSNVCAWQQVSASTSPESLA